MAKYPTRLAGALLLAAFCALIFIIHHNLELIDVAAKENAQQTQVRLQAMQDRLDALDKSMGKIDHRKVSHTHTCTHNTHNTHTIHSQYNARE